MINNYSITDFEKYTTNELRKVVLDGLVANINMGPHETSAGLIIPYYLSAISGFFDPSRCRFIVRLLTDFLENFVRPSLCLEKNEKVLIVGPEVAGGVLVSQLACSSLIEWADFVYLRKEAKQKGTKQQLEGLGVFTKRTKDSPVIRAIWLDDALSSGDSLVNGIKTLSSTWNIHIEQAVYLCDRHVDRLNMEKDKKDQFITSEIEKKCKISAIFDIAEVDKLIKQ